MENFFILLELPFDPAESDEGKILAAITQKQREWSDKASHPVHGPKVKGYLAMLDEIKRVMTDPRARAEEAAKAKKVKEEKKKELETKLIMYRAKGGLPDKELARLVKLYGPFGFTEKEIRALYGAEAKEEETIDPRQVLGKSQLNNIRNFMKALNMVDKTLYDFLGLPASSPCARLLAAADDKKKKILAKGNPTGEDEAAKNLCGLCATIFKSEEEKKKYDNCIKLTKYSAVNDAADEMARSNQMRIDPKMKDGLIDIAVRQYHVSVSDASVYINHYCEYMGYMLPENKIICGLCGTENPAGTTSCTKCGKPLVILCPSCGADNNNSAKACAKCGFDLTKMDTAVELLRRAKEKYAEKAWDEAERLVQQAKAYWPGHADILALEKTIADERKRAADTVAAILADVKEKRLYAARAGISRARAAGFAIDPAIAASVEAGIKEVEGGLAKLRSASGDEAFTVALRLSALITDCDELNESLKRFPPEPVTGLTLRQAGAEVTLSWRASPSIGDVSYVVVRKENAPANTPEDGTAVYTGKELSFTDHDLPRHKAFFYAVFALRIGVASRAARIDAPAAAVDPVTKPKAVGGDGMITLSWEKAASVTEIRVLRHRGLDKPASLEAYESVPCPRLDGLTISGLTNGEGYWLAVIAGHAIGGKTYLSEPVYLSAVPQKPAQPLQSFRVNLAEDIFRASWEASDWDVILFHAKRKPEYAVGIIYDLSDLLSKYEKIDINRKSLTEAEFRLSFVGECYVIPGVINASNVILNTAAYITSVPAVKDITCDLNSAATEMYVNYTWPKKVERSVLVYRMDTYPSGIDDPLAHKIECSKHQYDANEGLLITNPAKGTFYAEVYTYFEADDHRVYSEPCRALLSNEPQKDVFYTLRYHGGGFFNRRCTLTIELEVDGECVFPPFVVVGKYKSTPLKRGDGDVICAVEESTQVKRTHSITLDVSKIRSDTRLKIFFLNDKHYKSFKIACRAGNVI